MVNNNTSQNTVKVTTTQSESSIYLKRSELPKNLSSFKNDVGYISSTALNLWMKEHSYLSKNEIVELIKKANLTVIDTVNRTYDEDAINRLLGVLIDKVDNISGEFVAIKDRLNNMVGDFISSDKEGQFATKGDIRTVNNNISNITTNISQIRNEISQIDTTGFAKTSDVPTKVSQLQNDKNYITQSALTGYVKSSDLKKYAKVDDIPTVPDVSGFITRNELPSTPTGLATQTWVKNQKYLTKHQSLDGLAKLSDIPDVSGFATKDQIPSLKGYAKEDWVNSKGYLTESKAASKFAKKEDVEDIATKTWVTELTEKIIGDIDNAEMFDPSQFALKTDLKGLVTTKEMNNALRSLDIPTVPDVSGFLTKDDLPSMPSGLATQEWVKSQKYLTKQSVSDFAKKTDLDKFVTVDEIDALIDTTVPTDTSNFVQKSDLSGYVKTNTLNKYLKKSDYDTSDFATQEWVNAQGFLKDAGDTSEFARKTDLDKFVTKTSLSSTLGKYAKSSEVYTKGDIDTTYLKKDDAANAYLTKKDASSTYIPRAEVRRDYLKIEDYRGLRDATVINDTYNGKPLSDLQNDIGQLQNGFYVVENNKVVLVKKDSEGNRYIVKMYNGEGGEAFIRWEEDRS